MAVRKAKGVNDASVQRLNVRVTTEAYERLLIHSIKAKMSPGELVTQLIERHCRDWKVQANSPAKGVSPGSASPDGPVNQSEAVAA